MSTFELGVYVGLFLAIIFMLTGLSVLLFGKKVTSDDSNSARMEFTIGNRSMSMPYNINLIICGLGIFLLFITFNLIIESGHEKELDDSPHGSLGFIKDAHADNNPYNLPIVPGWVYFGYEKNPMLWNFDILNGDYNELRNNKTGLILKSKKDMNIRVNSFGNFTGSILGFLDPPPEIIGYLPSNRCVIALNYKSVGFSKIWINTTPTECP